MQSNKLVQSNKIEELLQYSNPERVAKNSMNYFNKYVPVYPSFQSAKKYMIKKPDGKFVHFGQMGYLDFTKHLDKKRQYNYLKRAMKIRGNWFNDIYSPNSLAIHLLWV